MNPLVLFVTTELPWPLDSGGKLRSFETLACLSRFTRPLVLSVSESSAVEADRTALAAALPGADFLPPFPHPVRIRRRPAALARAMLAGLARGEPYLVAKFRNRAYLAAARTPACGAPDLVWCDHLNVFPAASSAAGTRVALVLDEHNVESDLFRTGAGAGALLSRLAALEGARAARYEAAALRRADRVVAISPEDATRLSALGGGERVVTVLPSIGDDIPARVPPPPGDTVVFLGSLSWPPNAEAVRYLARAVLPALRRRRPGARVIVGGKGLDPAIEREVRAAGVELAGYVPDAAAFLRSGAAAVVPLRSGSGVAMKLLESLKAGVPTVTTRCGARGLPVRDGVEVLLAEEPEELARALERAMTDDETRRGLVSRARDYLSSAHSRTSLSRSYQLLVEDALSSAARRRG